MATERTAYVLDRFWSRRELVAQQMRACGLLVQTCSDISQLPFEISPSDVIFAHDEEPACNTVEAVVGLLGSAEHLPLVMYSTDPAPEQLMAATTAGASDYLTWPFDIQTVRRTLSQIFLARSASGWGLDKAAEARNLLGTLNCYERELLRALIDGASNKDIAREFKLPLTQVEVCRAGMMRKLNAARTCDAVRIGLIAGIGT